MGRLLFYFLFLGASLVAESSSAPIDSWLRTWQTRLRMEDWSIHIKVVPKTQLRTGVVGHVEWFRGKREATILLRSPFDYGLPLSQAWEEMEKTVLHELLHVRMSMYSLQDKLGREKEEELVEQLTETMFALRNEDLQRPLTLTARQEPAKPSVYEPPQIHNLLEH
jgi:hypothetical protein